MSVSPFLGRRLGDVGDVDPDVGKSSDVANHFVM